MVRNLERGRKNLGEKKKKVKIYVDLKIVLSNENYKEKENSI